MTQQHGIEFGYVGGDPAELMRICVENGMFTVSFLREGVTKVGFGIFCPFSLVVLNQHGYEVP